jgi:hypothetical protein
MTKTVINKIACFVSFVLLIIGCSNVVIADEKSPEEIVKRYYMADFNGVRLHAGQDENIQQLIAWKHEPGWDYAFIVDKISIHNVKQLSADEVIIEVRYHIIGIWQGEDFFEFDFNEVIDFVLMREGEKWKIIEPIFPPHISPSAAIKHLENLILTEGAENKIRAGNLTLVIERLKGIMKQ